MKERIEKLQKNLKNSTRGFLITSNTNRYYFTGFNSSAGCVLVTERNAYLLVDFRYGRKVGKAL